MWALSLLLSCREQARPNILLFTLDTTRRDAVGAYAPERPSVTPTLDGLASEGFRFTRAYTVTPLTIPAHSSLHTGLLPPRHGVEDNGDAFLSDEAQTLAERLHGAGYGTMAAVGAEVTSHHWGFAQGFDAYYDELEAKENRWRVERRAGEVAADAERWLASTDPGKPWFAWVHFFDAHFPYDPPERTPGLDPYRGEVRYVDSVVGQVIASLPKETLDNTWIFVLADHGEGLGDHGEGMHGVLLYDATTHIPLIVRPPGGAQPAMVIDAPVSIVDLYPTILSIAGAGPADGVDGFDLSGLLRGSGAAPPNDRGVYVESLYAYEHYGWAPQRAWADADHKYIDSTTPELYQRSDVRETDDLTYLQPDVAKRMKSELDAYRATLQPQETLSAAAGATQQAQLEALGYVTSDANVDPASGPLPDPVERMPVLASVEQGRQALQVGDLERAQTLIESVVSAEPTLVDPRLLLAQVQARRGDLSAAMATLDELLRIRRSSRVLVQLGSLKLQTGETQLGAALIDEAKTMDPYQPQTWYVYLPTLFATQDSARFQDAVREASSRLGNDPVIRAYSALGILAEGRADAAVPLLEAGIDEGPHPFLAFGLGRAQHQLGKEEEAEQALLDEIAVFPPAVPARRLLVSIYAEQGRYEEQLAQLDAIAATEEPAIDSLHSRAQALFNLGRFPEAKKVVDDCRRFAPKYPGCAMLEANVLDKLGDKDAAKAAYAHALELAGQKAPAEGAKSPDGGDTEVP